jgi:hypothetical protein
MANIISFQTFGLEFETEELTSEDCRGLMGYKPTHDASIERKVNITSKGIKLNLDRQSNKWVANFLPVTQDKLVGTELVSNILDSDSPDLFREINNLCYTLKELGEPDQCIRSGIHVHISFPNPNVRQLKSIMRLGRNFETLFYHLGGMGYEFRGIKNDSTYCRPITRVGPACIRYRNSWAQCFYIEDLIKPERFSIEDFWNYYGDLQNHRDRYNPVRYTWLNLFPMYSQGQYKGTLEFRVFNHTLNPYFITTIIKLCSYFANVASKLTYINFKEEGLLREQSIFDGYSSNPKDTLSTFKTLVEDEVKDVGVFDTARDMLNRVDRFFLPQTPVRSHLYNTRTLNPYWADSSYEPPIIYSDPKKPEYVDIHVLNGEIR